MINTTLIYACTFFISLMFCKIYEKIYKNKSNIMKIILLVGVFIPPIVLATLRYDVGTDYRPYIINYINIVWSYDYSIIWKFYSKEPLYVIINLLGYHLFGTRTGIGMFFIASCIYMFFIVEGISYFKKKISLTLGMFIFYMTYYLVFFNALRQMIAVSIILFAFRYIFEKKPIKYIFWVIIAGMFHKTAYLMVLLYLFNYKIDSKKINRLFYILILICPLFMLPIQKIIVYLTNKFMIYENYANMSADFDLKFLLYVLPMLILVAIKRNKILALDKRYEILIKILFLQLPFQFLGCFINIADRLAIYCAIFQTLLIPTILQTNQDIVIEECYLINYIKSNNISEKGKENLTRWIVNLQKLLNHPLVLKMTIIGWYIIYFLVMYTIMKGQGVYPYQFVLNHLEEASKIL